jgi:hypothetical protein
VPAMVSTDLYSIITGLPPNREISLVPGLESALSRAIYVPRPQTTAERQIFDLADCATFASFGRVLIIRRY